MITQDICIDDFDYPLGEQDIAKYPLKQRDSAKLLCYDGKEIRDESFSLLPELLPKDALLILNDTKVVFARLFFYKQTGSRIEIFCLEPVEPKDVELAFATKGELQFKCLIGNNKRWKQGSLSAKQEFNHQTVTLTAERVAQDGECWVVRFTWDGDISFAEVLEVFGHVPLPPYLNREAELDDRVDYQTVYANFDGSVAAPTAGLHFTEKTFEDLRDNKIATDFVTLHVGAGTFKPVSSKTIGGHMMHTEKVLINRCLVENLLAHIDKPITCVGTTCVRTIESLYWYGRKIFLKAGQYQPMDVRQWEPYEGGAKVSTKQALTAILKMMEDNGLNQIIGQTQLMIAPGYKYNIVKAMVTNFHQPKSTLLLLVHALIGEKWKEVYQHALQNGYRFLSYGDACYFTTGNTEKR